MHIDCKAITAVLGVLALGLLASGQDRKPGLWEVTSTMTWQQSPFPQGMGPMGGPHTTQICVTQQQIDKYGTVPPQAHGECQVTDIVKKATSMTAEMVCTGHMQGKGDIKASWTDSAHSTTNVHFTGSMQMGPNAQAVEWTVDSTSVYKGADCGNVRPLPDK